MSSAEIAAKVVKNLKREEVKILNAFTTLLKNHESVTIEQLTKKARMHIDRTIFSINKLNQMGLAVKNQRGYSLVMAGLDALALKMLADHNIVVGMGNSIGVGKEADVFEVFTPEEKVETIKFFRIGRTSFRDVKRKRSFKQEHHWLLVNINAAKREFDVLKKLFRAGVKVPEPHALAKHTIVMEFIEGLRLNQCEELEDPKYVLDRILHNVRLARKAGLISADLSEYNVLYDSSDIWIIDWPQNVSLKHPNASILLKRDIQNILNFFKKKYGLQYELAKTMNYVNS